MSEIKNRIIGSGIVPLDQILFNPRNWRVHPLNQQNALKGVLEEVGWVQEVIINQRTGHLVDGHLRCQLAAREGAKDIPVKYVDLSEDEEALVLATIDPIAAMAVTDKQKLDELFAGINSENEHVNKMLDDIAEKERLEYGKQEVDAEPQIDRAAELNEKWQVKTGDLWQIGEHRLLCGDSTKREDVERVMAGEKCGAVLTDPPYQMGKAMENDSLDDNDFISLHNGFISNLPLSEKATIICFHSPRTFPVALDAGRKHGLKFERMLYLTKPNDITFPWRGWLLKSEAILVFSKGGGSWVDVHPYTADTYLHNHSGGEIKDGGDKTAHVPFYHPSIKPMLVVTDLIKRIGGDLLYEPFAGSGTTMVACENLSRKCRAIEISPNYCAVILERMHTAFPELEIKRLT